MRNFIKPIKIIAISTLLVLYTHIVQATDPLKGCFVADKPCPALSSIKKQSNPDAVMLEPGKTYSVTGGNKPNPSYYQIEVNGLARPQRWVAVSCGQLLKNCADKGSAPSADWVEITEFRPLSLPHHRICGFPHPAVEPSDSNRRKI